MKGVGNNCFVAANLLVRRIFMYSFHMAMVSYYFCIIFASAVGNQTDILTKTTEYLTLNFGENDIIIIIKSSLNFKEREREIL